MVSINHPFKGTFLVTQDALGAATHTGGIDGAAYDFRMPVGTVVRATDPGKVLTVYEDVTGTGNFVGNYVTVKHFTADRQVYYATYVHLQTNGVIPAVGDTVTVGQPLAYSGNTGASGGPHLHYQFSYSTFEHETGTVSRATDSHDHSFNFNGARPSTGTHVTGSVPFDFANKQSTAENRSARSGSFETSNSVGFGTDTNDYQKLKFTKDGHIDVTLTKLIGNIDVRILNADGVQIAASTNSKRAGEHINMAVEAGKEYYLWIDPFSDKFSTYNLKVEYDIPVVFTEGNDTFTLKVAGSYDALGGDDTVTGTIGDDQIIGNAGLDTLYGESGDDILFGSSGADRLYGSWGDDFLHGGTGNDRLYGGHGNDILYVDSAADRVYEFSGQGTKDHVASSVSFALRAYDFVELLSTTSRAGTADINLSGNKLAQTIIGNAGDNYLSGGGAGARDILHGLGGNDTYRVYNTGDVIFEAAGGGADKVKSSTDYGLAAGVSVESLTTHGSSGTDNIRLTGNELSQSIIGNAGDNYLSSGGVGAKDSLRGLDGNDTYRIYNAADRVVETDDGGVDRIMASVSYALAAGVSVEKLTTHSSRGTADINLIGNELSQSIIGNAGDNYLSTGGAGDFDELRGLGGDDVYRVYLHTDVVSESANNGLDRVMTSDDFLLNSNASIEILSTHSSRGTAALFLGGNSFAQTIIGNAGDNILSSGAGEADLLRGLGGHDLYWIYNSGDVIIENANSGSDMVEARVDYTLGDGVSVENLSAYISSSTADMDLTGNEYDQIIVGNAGSNRLDGMGGTDILRGLAGADVFVFSSALDASNIDTIDDFSVVDDQIELDNTIFTALTAAGPLSAAEFAANTTGVASDADDRIIYDTDDGQLYYDADGTGAGAAQQFASLTPGLALGFNDFDVV